MYKRSVLIVEDDALLRELLAVALEQHGFIVETAANAADARRIFSRGDHDAVVIDIDLGSGPNGFDLAEAMLQRQSHTAVVFLTNVPDPRFVEREDMSGLHHFAYLRKSMVTDIGTLVAALDSALRGSDTDVFRQDLDPDRPLAHLTRKQIAVLRLAATGMSNAQIAQERGVSTKAVEDTIGRAAQALGVSAESGLNVRVAVVRKYIEATRGTGLPPTPES